MALIKCEECGKEVSDKSEQCIHCGNPFSKKEKNNIEHIKVEEETSSKKNSKSKNLNKMTFKDYLLLPFIVNSIPAVIAFLGLGNNNTLAIFLFVLNLIILALSLDWTNKVIKWYWRVYYFVFSAPLFGLSLSIFFS